MTGQLELFAEPDTNGNGRGRGGSLGYGPGGLLKRLVEQGLDPDALEPAARLVALLDTETVEADE